ncbi:NADH-quinone oxidoreductase subunit I [Insulibacter thermoxylanivorax]|uniref:NADH-quinone oxidoreductase subunit I n=1 Tax=Insulibacter thermoxylanivorax TaxID=2749268 RepID=A0A916VIJ5_9BACL|nr:NADH-quinone oxidoreductase subunit NuoI [Insulibacter thermoxylanivorax]GFR39395.1 NADH-quinone oxidoreductase subunit I [Insulibacter thermoxylanivorax]
MKGLVTGLGVTLRNMTKKKVTYKYPQEPLKMPNRFRGIQHFDPDKCIVCNQCARICPTQCISLTGKKNPDPESKVKLVIDTFDLNFEICILCDLCTEVCPTEAIVMTNNFELSVYSRDELYKDKEWLAANNTNIREENNVSLLKAKKGGAD